MLRAFTVMNYIACRMPSIYPQLPRCRVFFVSFLVPRRGCAARYKLVDGVSTGSGLGGVVADGAIRRCG